jgi:hypothetical protein
LGTVTVNRWHQNGWHAYVKCWKSVLYAGGGTVVITIGVSAVLAPCDTSEPWPGDAALVVGEVADAGKPVGGWKGFSVGSEV